VLGTCNGSETGEGIASAPGLFSISAGGELALKASPGGESFKGEASVWIFWRLGSSKRLLSSLEFDAICFAASDDRPSSLPSITRLSWLCAELTLTLVPGRV
jgi:hypothetical protein